MRINIIYDTKYGKGEEISKYLEDQLENQNVKIFSVKDTDPDYIRGADLYIFSTPVKKGKATKRMKRFVKNLDIDGGDVNYGLITTHVRGKISTPDELEKMLKQNNLQKKGDTLTLKVEKKKDPLEKGYEKELDKFLKQIL